MKNRRTLTALAVVLCFGAALGAAACKSGPDDAALTASVRKAVSAVPEASGVQVSVKDGAVTLSGAVPLDESRKTAETVARAVDGVKSVTNSITVKAPEPKPVAVSGDAEIRKSVEASLTRVGVTGVTVEVKDGVATLGGALPKAQWQKAVMAANEATPKPSQVKNAMTDKAK